VNRVELHHDKIKVNSSEDDKAADTTNQLPWTQAAVKKQMEHVNKCVKDGSKTFLKKEYTYLTIFCIFFAIILLVAVDQPW